MDTLTVYSLNDRVPQHEEAAYLLHLRTEAHQICSALTCGIFHSYYEVVDAVTLEPIDEDDPLWDWSAPYVAGAAPPVIQLKEGTMLKLTVEFEIDEAGTYPPTFAVTAKHRYILLADVVALNKAANNFE